MLSEHWLALCDAVLLLWEALPESNIYTGQEVKGILNLCSVSR